jgi:two-component system NarL family sensor kinase
MKAQPTTSGLTGGSIPGREAGRISPRTAAWLAWSTWVLSVTLIVSSFVLDYLTVSAPRDAPSGVVAVFRLLSLAYPTVGALIASRRPENPIGWVFCCAGLVSTFHSFAVAYADFALVQPGSLPGGVLMAWLSSWVGLPVVFLTTVLLLLLFPDGRLPSLRVTGSSPLFPEGRLPSRYWRAVVWMALCATALLAIWLALWPGALYSHPAIENPFGIGAPSWILMPFAAFSEIADVIEGVTVVSGMVGVYLGCVSGLFAATAMMLRTSQAEGEKRQQLKLFVYAFAVLVVGFLCSFMGLGGWGPSSLPWFVGIAAFHFFPIAAGIAIFKYRLYDIDRIINRTFVYGTLTASVVVIYVLIVGGLGALVQARGDLAVSLLAVGMVAVLFQPLRKRLQRFADRLILPARPVAQEPPESRGPGSMVFFGIGARGAAWIAWLVWVLSVAFIFAGWVLGYLIESTGGFQEPVYLSVVFGGLLLVFPTIGAFVAARRPENPIGWLFCLAGLALSAQTFTDSYATYALSEPPGALPGVAVMSWISQWIAFPVVFPVGVLLFLLFPDGRLPSRRWRFVAWTAVAGGVLLAMGDALMPGPLYIQNSVANPFGVAGVIGGVPTSRVWETCAMIGQWLLIGCCLIAVVSLVLRLRRARGEERQQIKWFATAAVIMPTGFIVASWTQWGTINEIAWTSGVLGFLMLPVTAAIAILRYRLWGIDIIVNRALVYGALTAVVVGTYALVVGVSSTLLQTSVGEGLLIPVLATGLIAVLFTPVRNRLQRSVNRLMYGDRDDPYMVLSRLGKRLESTLVPGAVLPGIVETVAQTLKLPYAAILLRQEDDFKTAAEYGTPSAEPVVLPLTYGTETVGRFVLAPRAPGEPFTASDLRLLEDLARQVGVAAYAVRLTADLQRSRERLVATREEERRRLRRDLHDGLGPQLATFTLKLDAARNLLASEPEAAGSLLLELKTQTQDTISGIRRLAYALRPPALDELGLVSALREQASTYGPAFSVEAPEELPLLPAAVEVAAYRIAVEAMTNTARHAHARVCRVRIKPSGQELELEVCDDGAGLPDGCRLGVGLSSMRERAAEIGGTCEIEAVPTGGTRVLAKLPLEASGKSKKPETGA